MRFDEFIERETKHDDAQQHDLMKERRQKWLEQIKKLYGMVKDSIEEYTQVRITEEETDLYEELLGHYKAPQMKITLGDFGKFVTLRPVGTYVIGAWGRVDMIGPNGGTVRLVLVDPRLKGPRLRLTESVVEEPLPQKSGGTSIPTQSEPELEWRLATMPPKIEYIPITKSTFREAVMNLFGYE